MFVRRALSYVPSSQLFTTCAAPVVGHRSAPASTHTDGKNREMLSVIRSDVLVTKMAEEYHAHNSSTSPARNNDPATTTGLPISTACPKASSGDWAITQGAAGAMVATI